MKSNYNNIKNISKSSKNKSIFLLFKKKILLNLIIILFIVSNSLYFIIDLNKYVKFFKDSTLIFNYINPFFSKGILEDKKLLPLLEKYYNTHNLKYFYYILKDNQKIAEELRNIVKYLQNLRESYLNHIFLHAEFTILVNLLFIFLIIISNINSFIFIKNFSIKFHSFLNKLDNVFVNFNFEIEENKISLTDEFNNLEKQIHKSSTILKVLQKIITMNPTLSLEQFIDSFGEIICSKELSNIFPCNRFSLAIYEKETDNLVAYHAYKTDIANIKLKPGFTQKLSDTSLKKIIEEKKEYRIIDDLSLINSESTKLLLQEGILSNLTIPVIINERLYGFLFFASKEKYSYNKTNYKLGLIFSNIVKFRFFYSYAIQDNIKTIGDSIVNIVEFKDEETYNHTIRVSLYSDLIADYLCEKEIITPQKAREIRDFAPLHDIGKIGIPDHILLKPSKLDHNEFEIIKNHPIIGAKIIDSSNEKIYGDIGYRLLDTAFNIILEHHENWDGSGYPFRKKGEEISIEARIVCIADVFDALTTKRPYKDAIPFEDSLKIINSLSGKKFDPFLIEIFNNKIDEIKKIYENLKDE
ncbi:MAG: HD domain-containing protein [Spirochaetes bacterium]|nr:HD domain-containing protein [Spirochaetota bacterium]